jgi:hypothetical protein
MNKINWGNYTQAYKAIHDAIHGIQTPHNTQITRNPAGYITQIQITHNTTTKTITITRNPNNLITQISEQTT